MIMRAVKLLIASVLAFLSISSISCVEADVASISKLGTVSSYVSESWTPTAAYLSLDEGAYVVLTQETQESQQILASIKLDGTTKIVHGEGWIPADQLLVSFIVLSDSILCLFMSKGNTPNTSIWEYRDGWVQIRSLSDITSGLMCDQTTSSRIYIEEMEWQDGAFLSTLSDYPQGRIVSLEAIPSTPDLMISGVWVVDNAIYYIGISKPSTGDKTDVYLCCKELEKGIVHSSLLFSEEAKRASGSSTIGLTQWLIKSDGSVFLELDNRYWVVSGPDLREVKEVVVKLDRALGAKQVSEISGKPVFLNSAGELYTIVINK
jgi:hypothetical protein